jgi:hypothetical protein
VRNDDLTATAQSLRAFCEEVKENTSVQFFSLGLDPNYDGIIFNLNHFLRSNTNLKELELTSTPVWSIQRVISINQAQLIVSAIETRQLELLDLTELRFGGGEILAACTKVKKLGYVP